MGERGTFGCMLRNMCLIALMLADLSMFVRHWEDGASMRAARLQKQRWTAMLVTITAGARSLIMREC
jgi:hypothetical protein